MLKVPKVDGEAILTEPLGPNELALNVPPVPKDLRHHAHAHGSRITGSVVSMESTDITDAGQRSTTDRV